MNRLPESLRKKLTVLRISKGLTLEGVAKICGVTASAVSNWESGTIPHPKHLMGYMKAVGAPATVVKAVLKLAAKK